MKPTKLNNDSRHSRWRYFGDLLLKAAAAKHEKTIFFRRLPERGTREKKTRLMKSKQTNGPHPPAK